MNRIINAGLPYRILNLTPPEQQEAFALGYDSVISGANEENCHFSIFMRKENTKAWEAGAAEAKRFMAATEKEHNLVDRGLNHE